MPGPRTWFWAPRFPAVALILYVVYIILVTVVLFNLLIAILGDAFERVKVR